MPVIDIIIIITGVLDLALSLAVLLRNKKSQDNTSFAVFSFFLGAWAFSIAYFRITNDPLITFIWAKSIYLSGSFIAASLFYFAYSFPEKKALPKNIKLLIVIPSAIHAILISLPQYLTRAIIEQPWGREVILGKPEYLIFSIYFLCFFYGALYVLWKKFQITTGRTKTQIHFILVSILIAGIISSIFDLFLPWFGDYQHIYVGPAASGIIFWFITYAIIRHKLWDFKLVVVRSFVYTLLVIWFTSIYTLAVFWISRYIFRGEVNTHQVVVYAVLAIFVAFTLQPLKNFLERVTDKIFFKNRYSSNDLLAQLTKIMAVTIQLNELTNKTLQVLLLKMHITRGEFYIVNGNEFHSLAENDKRMVVDDGTIQKLLHINRMIVFEEEEDAELKELLRKVNLSVVVPLTSSNKLHGVLLLGEKKSGDQYSQQDISVLEIFGPEIAVAIENARAYEEIKRFNRTLTEEVDKATTDLKNANVKLKEVDKLKTEFVSLASHELRTPMTAIKSYLWMALKGKGGPLTDKQLYYLDRAYRSTDRLIKLVNDMLNISRIESGRIALQMAAVDINKVISEVVEEVLPRAQELGIHISVNKDALLPHVLADADKIKEVLINLIGNSLKFTPSGGQIVISASVNTMVEVHVSDNGSGIAEEDLPKLFQKFGLIQGSYTVNKTTTQGTGLGLYICKSIIELHGGRIAVYSPGVGKGATFSFSLHKFDQKLLHEYQLRTASSRESVGLVHTQI